MISETILHKCAKVTVAYFIVFTFTIVYQTILKTNLAIRHRKKKSSDPSFKEKFMRYDNESLLAADRSVGNFIEWMGPFLSMFWLNALVGNGDDVDLGWIYVASRALYPILAVVFQGITVSGAKPVIFLATVPGYVVLVFYVYRVFSILYL